MKKFIRIITLFICGFVLAKSVFAQSSADTYKLALDTIWTLIAGFLVFWMQAGFALVETGFTRAKNAGNIIMKNLMDFAIGTIAFAAIGYGIMFGESKFGVFGSTKFFLSSLDPSSTDGLWQFTYWWFQVVFAATAATIVSGAMAERTKFISYLIYSFFISLAIYPVVGHWIWGGGWLSGIGFLDFAGSTVVHSVGGWAAFAGSWMLGPRNGKYAPDGKAKAIPGHNIPLAALGVFILWLGWFGFNPGSTTSGTNLSIAFIAVNTNFAAAAGAIATMVTVWIKYGKPDPSMTLNGVLAGLVAVTAGCASISPLASIIIGASAGIIVVGAIEFFDKILKIDDPVGAISVHGVCGAFGTLCVGLFANPSYENSSGAGTLAGLFYGGGFKLLLIQLTGVLSVFLWVFLTALIMFFILKKTIGLRVSCEEELKGLDIEEHGMESYAGFQIFITE